MRMMMLLRQQSEHQFTHTAELVISGSQFSIIM